MKLTNEQIAFLNQHGVPQSKVFDATGMKRSEYAIAMKALGSLVAIGVTPCSGLKHTIRNRSGHCVMCTPMYLAFQNRYEAEGEVYVATSRKSNFVKIGMAVNAADRLRNINYYGYGGSHDWEIKYLKKVKNAGRVESESQREISHMRLPVVYERDGENVDCREIFNCDVELAIATVRKIIAIYS